MEYKLGKRIWTEEDFESMRWHDCFIYQFRFEEELLFDIDYILKWNAPEEKDLMFTFWIAPATLVFKTPRNLSVDIKYNEYDWFEIVDIRREVVDDTYQWVISTQIGEIRFESDGYTQYIRQDAFFEYGQTIDLEERNGICIEKTIEQENPNRSLPSVISRKEKEKSDYECMKQRRVLVENLEELELGKERGALEFKDYLLKRRALKEQIAACVAQLEKSRFGVDML